MPIGVIVNSLSVLGGGLSGWKLGKLIPKRIQKTLPVIFGLCSLGIGVVSITKVAALPPVILSIILGAVIGEALRLEDKIARFFAYIIKKLPLSSPSMDLERFITVTAVFCVSGMGIFGALTEGINGDASILFSKAVLDFFTALIFAVLLGPAVGLIAVPQFIILVSLFYLSRLIMPFISDAMLMDFTACGGIFTVAAGLRMAKILNIPLMNLLPAFMLVMPVSALWTLLMG